MSNNCTSSLPQRFFLSSVAKRDDVCVPVKIQLLWKLQPPQSLMNSVEKPRRSETMDLKIRLFRIVDGGEGGGVEGREVCRQTKV